MIDLYEGDEMQRAINKLEHVRIRFQKKTAFHIKVGRYNFFPGKGTIYLGGQPRGAPHRRSTGGVMIGDPPQALPPHA